MHWRRKWQPHSSVLAWRIPGTGKHGGLLSMGSHRVRNDWGDLAAPAATSGETRCHYVPWKENYEQPRQHIKKQKHHFANEGPSSQGYGFSSVHVWMWVLHCEESWPPPKNWCFWTVVLEKTLESPLDCKEIQPVHSEDQTSDSLEEMMLKLKLQYFGHFMRKVDSLEKTLMLGGIGGMRRRGWQGWDGWMASLTQWTWVWVNSGSWWWTGSPGVLQFMESQRVRHDWATEMNWTETLSVWYHNDVYMSKLIRYTTTSVNNTVNYWLRVILMCQYSLLHCKNVQL